MENPANQRAPFMSFVFINKPTMKKVEGKKEAGTAATQAIVKMVVNLSFHAPEIGGKQVFFFVLGGHHRFANRRGECEQASDHCNLEHRMLRPLIPIPFYTLDL